MTEEKQEKQSVKPFVGEVEVGIYIETYLSRFNQGYNRDNFFCPVWSSFKMKCRFKKSELARVWSLIAVNFIK